MSTATPDDEVERQLEEQLVGTLMLGVVHCRMALGRIDAHSTPLVLGLSLPPRKYHRGCARAIISHREG